LESKKLLYILRKISPNLVIAATLYLTLLDSAHPTFRCSLFVCGINHTVVQVMNISIRVTSPSRERSTLTTTTKDCKSQDKHQHLSATIKCSTDNVVVLDKQLWVATTYEPLREEPDDEEHGNTGVDSDEKPAHVPEYHRDVDVLEERMFGVAVSQPEWYRDEEAEEVGDGDPFVSTSNGEELGGHRPGDSESIESSQGVRRLI
jgi:hypothetical protein